MTSAPDEAAAGAEERGRTRRDATGDTPRPDTGGPDAGRQDFGRPGAAPGPAADTRDGAADTDGAAPSGSGQGGSGGHGPGNSGTDDGTDDRTDDRTDDGTGPGSGDGQGGSGPGVGPDDGHGQGPGPRFGRRGFLAGVGIPAAGGALAWGAAGPDAWAAGRGDGRGDGPSRGGEGGPQPRHFEGKRQLLVPEVVLLPKGPVRDHAVLVEDGRFHTVGPARQLTRAHPGLHPVRLERHLLMPGFVDAHTHLVQSFGKARTFGQPSEIFKTIWEPLEHALDEESAYLSAKLTALQALRGGFTTLADAGSRAPVDSSVLARATEEAGIRCVLSKVVSDGKGGPEHLHRWDGHRLVHPSLAVPVPEDATDRVLKRTADLCAEAKAPFQIHVNEHLASVERSLKSVDRRPLAHLHHVGALGPHTLAAHATLLTPDEMRMLADTGAAVSYNPVASAWKGNAVAQATMMAAWRIRFGLGTDSTRGDGFRLLDAAESAQRLTSGLATGDSSCGTGRLWVSAATAGGADAVGLGARTGEIAEGKAADYLLVDLDVPELTPTFDLDWELVRLAGKDQLTAVVVDGRLRLWKGRPAGWDADALVRRVTEVAPEVFRRAGIDRVTPRGL
ncbi:amidohydrolase family protein [Streptomyces cacaoi]|uniref:amidohydrolase family protein n=1 Tax=Streptomyces cacaoi TaxID=1898 RepID=UPI0011F29900